MLEAITNLFSNFRVQLMLQTAPVLLLFHPTVGPNAKADLQPTRYDFTAG